MSKRKLATYSFDDGGYGDVKVIQKLEELGLKKATFYLPVSVLTEAAYFGMKIHEIVDFYKNWEIGSHSLLHLRLSKMAHGDAKMYLARSKKHLEGLFGRTISLVAYPYGDCGGTVLKAAAEAGYEFGRSVIRDSVNLRNCNRLKQKLTGILDEGNRCWNMLKDAVAHEEHIHLLGHPFRLMSYFSDRGTREKLGNSFEFLKANGYEFVTNSEFFKGTIK